MLPLPDPEMKTGQAPKDLPGSVMQYRSLDQMLV